MNGWFLAAGALLVAAFFVHVVSGNRFYCAARPSAGERNPGEKNPSGRAYEAWLKGRCGVQMITVDLALAAVFVLLLGVGALPRNYHLELFLLLTYGGWCLFWIVSLICEKAGRRHYLSLCHWALFLVVAVLLWLGMQH